MNVDELVQAITAPQITIDGKSYTGRILSIFEMQSLYQKLEELGAGAGEGLEGAGFLKHVETIADLICTDLVPGLPKEALLRKPVTATLEVFQHFLAAQLRGIPASRSSSSPVEVAAAPSPSSPVPAVATKPSRPALPRRPSRR